VEKLIELCGKRDGMKIVMLSLAVLVWGVALTLQCQTTQPPLTVRQPGVAGSFYPGNAKELAATVDGLLSQAKGTIPEGQILALVAPHAGYPFSGGVAAYSYALLKGRNIHRVVIIAPSHLEAFDFASVYDGDAYATPLGDVPVDKAFARKLAGLSSSIQLSSRGHAPYGSRAEHSLEVQLPFLQRALSNFELVPIIMGDQSYAASRSLGVALAELIRGTDTLIVASSDLSHYHPYDEAVALDHKTLSAIHEWDYLTLSKNFQTRTWEACGGGPIVAAMIAADRLGADRAEILKYANSGDVTSDRKRVVGYGAVALMRTAKPKAAAGPRFSLNSRDKKELLDIARKSVESAVREKKLYQVPAALPQELSQDRGAFVTLRKNGELRGCIGYTASVQSLALTVRDVAAFAALRDSRFPPVTAKELPQLTYEISVLSPLRRVGDVHQIRVGQHGLLIKKGDREGLLLPQVATEQHWDRKTLLDHTALKAGLPANAWRDKDADIFIFSALVFRDSVAPDPVSLENPFAPRPSSLPADLR
jgi:AmmeMemoRadiSam system protein B/AmmeMemoRadiSam system protein A